MNITQKLERITYEILTKQELFDEDINLLQETYINELFKIISLNFNLSVNNEILNKYKEKGDFSLNASYLCIAESIENPESYKIFNYFMLSVIKKCMAKQDRQSFIASLFQKYGLDEFDIEQIEKSYFESSFLTKGQKTY